VSRHSERVRRRADLRLRCGPVALPLVHVPEPLLELGGLSDGGITRRLHVYRPSADAGAIHRWLLLRIALSRVREIP
jgi:hypothetical protein